MNETVESIVGGMLRHELDRKDAELYTAYRRLEKAGRLRDCLEEKGPGNQRRRYLVTVVGAKRRQGGKARRESNKRTECRRAEK